MVSAYRPVAAQNGLPVLPLCPPVEKSFEAEAYRRFMRYFRETVGPMEHRILVAIHMVSSAMGINPATTAKLLVDMGLRANRKAFPASFVEWEFETLPLSVVSLRHYWDQVENGTRH